MADEITPASAASADGDEEWGWPIRSGAFFLSGKIEWWEAPARLTVREFDGSETMYDTRIRIARGGEMAIVGPTQRATPEEQGNG